MRGCFSLGRGGVASPLGLGIPLSCERCHTLTRCWHVPGRIEGCASACHGVGIMEAVAALQHGRRKAGVVGAVAGGCGGRARPAIHGACTPTGVPRNVGVGVVDRKVGRAARSDMPRALPHAGLSTSQAADAGSRDDVR